MVHTYLLLNAAPSAPNTKEKSMSQNISYDPSPSDYQKIEARARALQGEATLHLFQACVHGTHKCAIFKLGKSQI